MGHIEKKVDSRVYLFGFSEPISSNEADSFFINWVHHKKKVQVHWEVLYKNILLVNELDNHVLGGCAIDQLYRWVKGQGWVRDRIFYLDSNEEDRLQSLSWEKIPLYFQEGRITEETQVVDLTICKMGDWEKNPSLLKKIRDTSYARLLVQKV